MDIVYLVKVDPKNDSEELRYSLRSLKNIPHGKVIIVGEKPDWVTNVTYIPVPQIYAKAENVVRNLHAAAISSIVSEDFLLMNDDFFIMKEIPAMPNYNFGSMREIINHYNARYPEGSKYISSMTALYGELLKRGYPTPLSYELHAPMVLNKTNVEKMFDEADMPLLHQFRTFYGNYFNVGGTSVPDVKVFLEPEHNDKKYNENPEEYLKAQTFLSATGGSFKRAFTGDFIRATFAEKSPYEA